MRAPSLKDSEMNSERQDYPQIPRGNVVTKETFVLQMHSNPDNSTAIQHTNGPQVLLRWSTDNEVLLHVY